MTISVYPEYKVSGVPWLGHVPEHWEVKALKYVASCNDESVSETTPPDFELQYVDISSVDSIRGITAYECLTFENAPSRARRIARNGDTIVSTVRTYLKAITPIVDPPPNLVVSTGFAVIRPKNEVFSGYLSYLLRCEGFVSEIMAYSVGISYPAINPSDLMRLRVSIPPLEEQRAIASFLDRKTAQIDELIAKKEALLKKLDEKRTTIITQAVTKGLDPSVPMKDSGVEWIGEIPEHWEVKQTRHVFRILSGSTPKSGEKLFWDGDIYWFTPEDLGNNQNKNISESRRKITDDGYKSCGTSLAKANSIVLSTRAPIGHIALSTVPACCNQGCRILEQEKGIPEFRYYTLLSAKPILQSLGQGSTFMELPRQSLASFKLPCPPHEEQQAISNFITQFTAKTDRQNAQVIETIERLKEYRSALITDAVTGKMDVHSIGKKESLST